MVTQPVVCSERTKYKDAKKRKINVSKKTKNVEQEKTKTIWQQGNYGLSSFLSPKKYIEIKTKQKWNEKNK